MNNIDNRVALFLGMFLGQVLSTVICVYVLQKKKDIAYWPAFKAYVISEQGGYIISAVVLVCAMFVFPEQIDPKVVAGVTTYKAWAEKLQLAQNFRWYSLIFGLFAPIAALVFFQKGKKAIEKKDAELSVS